MNDELRERVGSVPRECLEIGSLLSDRLTGRLGAEEERAVAAHLARCAACRETAAALVVVRREAAAGAEVDLWPRLRRRLEPGGGEEPLRLRFPSLGWRLAAALAAVVMVPWLVREPVEFLALIVGLL